MADDFSRPIGVFDSGVGGISVLLELVKLMPNEDFIYFGDSLNAPYGLKKRKELEILCDRTVSGFIKRGCKAIVIACNTATSAAAEYLRNKYPSVPIIGMEPAVKPAIKENPNAPILVIATDFTLREEKFQKLLSSFGSDNSIFTHATMEIVDFVEKNDLESPELYDYLRRTLTPYLKLGIKGIVLGCTHFSFVRKAIFDVLGDSVRIYDGALGTAKETLRRLSSISACANASSKGTVVIENSLKSHEDLAKKLFLSGVSK